MFLWIHLYLPYLNLFVHWNFLSICLFVCLFFFSFYFAVAVLFFVFSISFDFSVVQIKEKEKTEIILVSIFWIDWFINVIQSIFDVCLHWLLFYLWFHSSIYFFRCLIDCIAIHRIHLWIHLRSFQHNQKRSLSFMRALTIWINEIIKGPLGWNSSSKKFWREDKTN